MANINDIDTKQSVGKFLQRQSVTPPADNTANTADETQAVLQTVAMSFLLYPQSALNIVLNAKNSLQQVVQADLSVVEFMLAALRDINNRDIPITDSSDLLEAQTALVELDRLGRVDQTLQAFSRYQNAISRFLDDQLAPTLKRNGTGTFERTGDEARQDLFNILSQFSAAHTVMISLLKALQNSISDFRSVSLTGLISSLTISRVRSSLNRVKSRIDSGTVSKTTAAIELLSGSASLLSISDVGDLFDPAVDTGSIPKNTTVTLLPDSAKATALSTAGPWTLGTAPWRFRGTMDPLGPSPAAFNFQIPGPGAGGRVYVSSENLTTPFNIPASSKLYLRLEGAAVPEFEISLTVGGAVPLATVVFDISSALGSDGSCIQNPGTNGFLIFGSLSITAITIRASSTGFSGTFTLGPSAHSILGFSSGQTSLPVGKFNSITLAAAIRHQLPNGLVVIEADKVRITSTLGDFALSSLFFDDLGADKVQSVFGFSGTVEALPNFFELISKNIAILPADLGVYVGSIVTAAEDPQITGSAIRVLNNEPITDIQGTRIFISPAIVIPRRTNEVVVTSTIVATVQQMIQGLTIYTSAFDEDVIIVKRVLSPIVSKPTRAQINEANQVLQDIVTRLQSLLSFLDSIVVRLDQSQFSNIATQIFSSLEERGLDRAQELLSSGQFSSFFSLDSSNASKSNRLLTAMENVARQDLPISTLEVDIDDDQTPRGTNPDSTTLAGAELEGSGSLVTNT